MAKKEEEVIVAAETPVETGSQKWMSRMRERNPGRKYDDDPEEFYNELNAYDEEQTGKLSKYESDSNRMKELLLGNPELAGIFSEVSSGKHPAIAFVEQYGDGIMALKDDPEMAEEFVSAQKAYMDKVTNSKAIEEEQNANLAASSPIFDAFIKEKGMSDEEGGAFFDEIRKAVNDVFMFNFTPELLAIFYNGMNYDTDVQAAAQMGEVNGKNQKIRTQVKEKVGDGLPAIAGGAAVETKEPKKEPIARKGFFDKYGDK